MPRCVDIIAIQKDARPKDILALIRSSGLSRFPVYGRDINDILGILNTLCFQFFCDLIIQLTAHQNQVSVLLTLAENFSKSQVLGYSKVQGHT